MPAKLKQPARLKNQSKPKKKLTKQDEYVRLLDNDTFVVIDIETSGLSPKVGGEIIELAAVKVVRGRVVDEKATLIQPQNRIYAKTTQITGITNEDLVGKPSISDVIPGLVRFIGNSVLVAHNARFEELFLNHEFNKHGFSPKNEWACTMKMFRHMFPERKKMGLGAKLADLAEHYNVDLPKEEQHRALVDTLATTEAFLKLRADYLGSDVVQEELMQPAIVEEEVMIEEDKVDKFVITNVRYWEKCYNKKRDKWGRRLYVNFYAENNVRGSIYYDLFTKSFIVQQVQDNKTKEDVSVDLEAFEKAVLAFTQTNTIDDHLTRLGVFANIERAKNERITDKNIFLEDLYDMDGITYKDYVRAAIPYDVFEVTEDGKTFDVYVTNEKRGSKYRYYFKKSEIK